MHLRVILLLGAAVGAAFGFESRPNLRRQASRCTRASPSAGCCPTARLCHAWPGGEAYFGENIRNCLWSIWEGRGGGMLHCAFVSLCLYLARVCGHVQPDLRGRFVVKKALHASSGMARPLPHNTGESVLACASQGLRCVSHCVCHPIPLVFGLATISFQR